MKESEKRALQTAQSLVEEARKLLRTERESLVEKEVAEFAVAARNHLRFGCAVPLLKRSDQLQHVAVALVKCDKLYDAIGAIVDDIPF